MVLSDQDIRRRVAVGSLQVDPFEPDNVEPSSLDLRLGDDFKRVRQSSPPTEAATLSLEQGGEKQIAYDELEYCEDEPVVLNPGELILATTLESFVLPDDLTAQVLGRSSLGRLGVSVHQTAGWIDPGFSGRITLELSNHGPVAVELVPGLRMCQIVFSKLSTPAAQPYGHSESQYQGQHGATESGMNFE